MSKFSRDEYANELRSFKSTSFMLESIAHDVRNQTTSVYKGISILETVDNLSPEEIQEILEIAKQSIDSIIEMMNAINIVAIELSSKDEVD